MDNRTDSYMSDKDLTEVYSKLSKGRLVEIVIQKIHEARRVDPPFKKGDKVIAFNSKEWSKTGDLPQGNGKYLQYATILKLRVSHDGEDIADVEFEGGQISNGHFVSCLAHFKQ